MIMPGVGITPIEISECERLAKESADNRRPRSEQEAKTLEALKLFANVGRRLGWEFGVHLQIHFAERGGNVAAMIHVARDERLAGYSNPEVGRYLEHMKEALMPEQQDRLQQEIDSRMADNT